MLSWRGVALGLAAVLAWQTAVQAQIVIPETALERHGLTRGWRAQVDLNRAIDRIAYITQFDGVLYIQTKHGVVHAMDAETGKKIWSAQIGQMTQVSFAPAVNHLYLAVITGTTLHVLDRITGKEKFDRVLRGVPGAGPAVSDTMVFVYMVNGFVEGYNLEDQHALRWFFQSIGRVTTQPVVSDGSIAWTTDRGFFYVADSDPPKVRLRVETHAEITSRPAHWAPYLYACSLSGSVYALNEESGETVWKFPAGSTISKQPAAVKGVVYICPDAGGMYALDGETGAERWFAPNISQFCAVSATHVYAIDHLDRLTILDAERGTRLSTMPLGDVQIKPLNQQTDRIYLASDSGVVQCLHELSQPKALVYMPPRLKRAAGKSEKRKRDEAKADGQAAQEKTDADAGEKPGDDKPDDAGDASEDDAMSDDKDAKPEKKKEADSKDDPFG
ncbi:MAG TPA: PQQ-binding-like beta-propeller repeat protein [Pirellulales bacterium]